MTQPDAARITFTDSAEDAQIAHLRQEIARLAEEAYTRAEKARKRAKKWNIIYIVLGLPAAVLAGISGATGLASADARIPAAFLALIAAGLVAAAGFLQGETRVITNRRCRSAWQVLEGQARVFAARHGYGSRADLRASLERLYEMRKAIIAGDYDTIIGAPLPASAIRVFHYNHPNGVVSPTPLKTQPH
ncbi:hypothetical protein [Nonomuraea sp. C10]|uniref:hypothetical protein n=1 Tax=Nonomuraea sp. C10 TaxID=2600577 RepID=UPI0011CDEE94|nr:hypothetical protein [Nonomuraea sp. C10]TXK40770.1 hypothetical protein FR742_15295 [Nonomuraea sp. C10]